MAVTGFHRRVLAPAALIVLAALSLPAGAEEDGAMAAAACADARFVLNVCWEVSTTDCDEARALRNAACGATVAVAPAASERADPALAAGPVSQGIIARPGMALPAGPAGTGGAAMTPQTTHAVRDFDVDAANRSQIRRVPGLLLDGRSVSGVPAGIASVCADGAPAFTRLAWNARGELTERVECS